MGEKMKENWQILAVNLTTTIIAVMLTAYITTKDLNAREIKKEIDSKADKSELNELKQDNKEAHGKFINRSEFELLMNTMSNFNERQVTIEGDIKKILERLPKK